MDPKKYLTADFLDILFEGKNKEYGAYTLRRQYNKRVAKALSITVLICLLAVGALALSNYLQKEGLLNEKPVQKDVVLQNVEIKQPDQPPPPPPPKAPEPPKVKPQEVGS